MSGLRIELYGDSTMWGRDGEQAGLVQASVTPQSALQQAMDLRFGDGATVVVTRAVDGTTTQHLIDGTDGVNDPWPRSVRAHVAVVNFGINDSRIRMPVPQYQDNLRRLAVAGETVMVFQTPLPERAIASRPAADSAYAPQMREVSAELGIPVSEANQVALDTPNWHRDYVPDGTHPDSAGYQRIVDRALMPALEPVVAQLRCEP